MSARLAYLEDATQITSGEIKQINHRNNQPYSKRDLGIEMITFKREYQDLMGKLWVSMSTLWRYIDVERIDSTPADKKIFYDVRRYNLKVAWVSEQLKKVGLNFYDERQF